MAGHSHWAKIKRAKGATDAKRGKVWGKIARKLIIAARGGGGDPAQNLNLRYTIEEAKASNMHKDTIANAIKKGTGELGGDNYESAVYEAYAPGGVAMMIDCLTNNRSRTAPDLRAILDKNGGNLATSGAVSFQFSKVGIISIKADAVNEDRLMEVALDAGADDVRNVGEGYDVITSPVLFHQVKEAISTTAGIAVEGAEVTYVPNSSVAVEGETAARVMKLIDALEDNEDVQSVSHNAELPEDM